MVAGETEDGRSLGEALCMGDFVSEYSSPSEREPRVCIDARDAKAAAVAAADSSIVPVWWFW